MKRLLIFIFALLIISGCAVQLSEQDRLNSWNDGSSDAIKTVPYEHHELHDGNYFEVGGAFTMASADTAWIILDVGDTTKAPHMLYVFDGLVAYTVELYRDVTYIRAPDALTIVNPNLRSTNSSTLDTAFVIHMDSTLITSKGTSVFGSGTSVGAGQRIGGTLSRAYEMIPPNNTTMGFRITSDAATNKVSFFIPWYEHIPQSE